jgi:nucleoside-diphosphate-sugar epimerase
LRVFVAGATGAIGRPLVARLLEAGHEVIGMTRSDERAADLREGGAEAVVCDAHDSEALRAAVTGARPEVLVHQLTDLPQEFNPRYDYGTTNELRSQVTRDLIAAARDAGAGRFVAQGVAFFYVPTGSMVKDEEDPVTTSEVADGKFAEAGDALADLERQVLGAEGMDGLVLRYGFFYGPGTWFAEDTKLAKAYRLRLAPIVGSGEGVFSFVHVDDAAAATVAAVERAAPGIYNVVDDEPAAANDWMPAFAEAVGGEPPLRVPAVVGRAAGGQNAEAMETMRGASNAKAKRELGWEPRYASWRQGFKEGLR